MEFNGACVFHAQETDPAKDRFVIHRAGYKSTLDAVPDHASAIKAVVELANSGVKSIELCSYFGPMTAAKIFNAVGGKVAVAPVMFGGEYVLNAVRAFAPDSLRSA
jgi:hypothetical protein